MKEFITKIYEYENFPIYLGSIIFILIIAFFVVFFLGKKDQKKIEKTQRLEKVKDDAFKEISTPVSPEIESSKIEDEKVQNEELEQTEKQVEEPIIAPPVDIDNYVNDMSSNSESYEEPVIAPPVFESPFEEKQNNEANEIVEENIPMPEKDLQDNFSDDLIKNELDDYNYNSDHFNDLANSIANELNELEKQQEIAKPILNENTKPAIIPPEITENTYEEEDKKDDSIIEPERKSTIVNDVFSSVYVPKKEEPLIEDTMAIELPKLKNEPILKDEETKLNIK